MKKIFALFFMTFCVAWATKAQNTALAFDGVDDVAEVFVNQPTPLLPEDEYTFEAICSPVNNGNTATLLYIPQDGGGITFGITDNDELFLSNGEEPIMTEPLEEINEQCIHVAVRLLEDQLTFFLNGEEIYSTTSNGGLTITNQSHFYLGMSHPDNSTAFEGIIDEFRIWPRARSNSQIAQYVAQTPDYTQVPRFLILPFWEGTGSISFDAYQFPYNYAKWNHLEGNDMNWAEPCFEEDEPVFEPRIGSDPLPQCIPPTNNPLEHVCNGNFEQYDPILNAPPAWATPAIALQPTNGQSDVVQWQATDRSPDMFVRNGLGGIPLPAPAGFPATQTWNWPNPANNALAVLGSYHDFWVDVSEKISTQLLYTMNSGGRYEFRARCHTGGTTTTTFTPDPDITHTLTIVLRSSANPSQNHTAGSVTLNNYANTALQATNGWEDIMIPFTFPATLPSNTYDILELQVHDLQMNRLCYTAIDEVSLLPITTSFPQYINTGKYNDTWHRILKTDAQDNVYVSGKISNTDIALEFGLAPNIAAQTPLTSNVEVSSFVARYNADGSFEWMRYFNGIEINDFDLDQNGNLFLVGAVNPGTTVGVNYVQTPSKNLFPQCGSTIGFIDYTDSDNLILMRLNMTNGQNIGTINSYGGLGDESAVNVEIIGSKAYITAFVAQQTYSVFDPITQQTCHYTEPGNLKWPTSATTHNSSKLLVYDLASGAPQDYFGNYNMFTDNFWDVTSIGNDLFIMYNYNNTTLVDKVNVSNTNNSLAGSLPLSGPPVGLYADGTHLYTLTSSTLRKFTTNFQGVGAKSGIGSSLGVTGIGQDIYIARLNPTTDIVTVEKMNTSNISISDWSVQTSQTNAEMVGLLSIGDRRSLDMAPLNTNTGVAMIANFITTNQSWSLNLPPKTLAGNNGSSDHFGNSFVSTILDLGSSGFYNKTESDNIVSQESNLMIYPNPILVGSAKGKIHIESDEKITNTRLLTIDGKALISASANGEKAVTLPVQGLAAGIYLIEVTTQQKVYVQRIVVQ